MLSTCSGRGQWLRSGNRCALLRLRYIVQSRECGQNGDTHGHAYSDQSDVRTLAECEAQFPVLENICKLRELQGRTVNYFLNDYYRVIEN